VHLLLAGGGRQVAADAGNADLCTIPVLRRDVDGAARVVADQHGGQAGNDAARGQRGHPAGELSSDASCGRLAVQDDRGHGLIVAGAIVAGAISARSAGLR
jgi:hypothetical protein